MHVANSPEQFTMSYEKIFEFNAAFRGYHYYRRFWVPKSSQSLCCYFEPDNPFDNFAIKVCEEGKSTPVGHLPWEISRATKFFIDRGATVKAQLISEHYRRSPLVQGGMEIACKVTVSIPGTCVNLLLMERYKQLIKDTYSEPNKEEILGSYLNVQENNETERASEAIPRKKKEKSVKKKEVKTKDIRNFFNPVVIDRNQQRKIQSSSESQKKIPDIVEIVD